MMSMPAPDSRMVLRGGDVAALFGLDMADASDASGKRRSGAAKRVGRRKAK
jgi:hypothetical protein